MRVILDQGAMSSSQGRKKNDPNLCVSSLCKPYFRIVQEKNYPSQILTVILVQGPCSNIQSHTIFVQSRAAVSRRRNSVILAQGPCNSVQRKRRRQAQSEVRTSGPALEGTIVSPLVNTTSSLSGGRRGGDVSVRSFTCRRPAACPSFGLGFGLWNLLPSFFHQEGIRQRRLQHTTT